MELVLVERSTATVLVGVWFLYSHIDKYAYASLAKQVYG